MSDSDYYNIDALLSRNGVINMVVGPRGNGKTYAAKRLVIKRGVERGDEFIYLRRYNTELRSVDNWFSDIAHEFPDYEFRVTGKRAEYKLKADIDDKKAKWTTIGYFVPLSKGQQFKSVPFPNVKWIVFDEFIIERGHVRYLNDEVKSFLDFYSTVDRWQDRVRAILLGNTISVMNPYFIEWDIRPDSETEFITKNDNFIVVQFTKSELFTDRVYQTRFGQFVKETEYGDYSVGGEFSDNNDSMLGVKGSNYTHAYTVATKNGTFSVWIAPDYLSAHVSERVPRGQTELVLDPKMMNDNRLLVDFSFVPFSQLRGMFARGKVTFSSPQARNMFYELWRRK